MNTLRKQILAGLAALSMGAAAIGAHAQTQAPEGRHGSAANMEQRQAKMAEFRAQRQAKLHDALKLNGSQEAAWKNFVSATAPAPRGEHMDRAAFASLPAPARMEKMIALSKERTAHMESQLAALNTFYAVLTPEQKKVFDQNTMRGFDGKHHGHRGHEAQQG
ncbi:MAG: Spy/CpxP family protein refolding chaperone [Massilia sp.]